MSKLYVGLLLLLSILLLTSCEKNEYTTINEPYVNTAPSTPSNPNPADESTGTSRSPVLSWTCADPDAGDTIKYDLYFGSVNPPNILTTTNWVYPNYGLSSLEPNLTYYWRVTAKDSRGASSVGPTWRFTTGGASNNPPLELTNWKCYVFPHVGTLTPGYVNPTAGVFERVSDGLKVYGSGYRTGALIHYVPTTAYQITNKTIYMKWKANGAANFMGVGVWLQMDTVNWATRAEVTQLSTHNSSAGSVKITDDVWYYTRISLTTTNYSAITSSGNYDNLGGTIVQSKTAPLSQAYQFPIFGLWDTYASTAAYAILGEIRIE